MRSKKEIRNILSRITECITLAIFNTDELDKVTPKEEIQNSLSRITDEYIKYIDFFDIDRMDNLNVFLRKLPDLTLDENYVLDDFRSREETNSELRLYVRPKKLGRPLDTDFELGCVLVKKLRIANLLSIPFYKMRLKPLSPFEYITLPFTAEAIWQAFLLSQTFRLTGMRWHGGYARRTFLLLEKDIVNIHHPGYDTDERIVSLRNEIRRIWSPDLNVSVTLHDDFASISHCWFDAWHGLIQMKWKVKYDAKKRQVTEIKEVDKIVLVEYDCGMRY